MVFPLNVIQFWKHEKPFSELPWKREEKVVYQMFEERFYENLFTNAHV